MVKYMKRYNIKTLQPLKRVRINCNYWQERMTSKYNWFYKRLGPLIPRHSVTRRLSETCPRLLQCTHDSGKKTVHFFLCKEACGLELVFCSCFFFPFFVVKYWASCRGSPQVSGVSLLVHYISESSTKGRMNAKQGHLTSSLSDPGTASVTLRAQFWEILKSTYSLSNTYCLSICYVPGSVQCTWFMRRDEKDMVTALMEISWWKWVGVG